MVQDSGSPPAAAVEPTHVGCSWCVRGYAPVWRHDTLEFVHIVQERFGNKGQHARVTHVVCQAFKKDA